MPFFVPFVITLDYYIEASEPKWVNPDDIQYGVNSLRFGGLPIVFYNSYGNWIELCIWLMVYQHHTFVQILIYSMSLVSTLKRGVSCCQKYKNKKVCQKWHTLVQ